MPLTPSQRRVLDDLHDRSLNFDASELPSEGGAGWHIDDYCQALPVEPPGAPLSGGSWSAMCRFMRDYEFADPKIVRGLYHSHAPIEDRTMLLEARFYCLRFLFGVRVAGVIDEVRTVEGCPVRVWGWSYRTLQGHLEMGQMAYEAWKWLDTGTVEFRIHVVSRAATIPNPLIRLGFRLFGRRMQKKFARRALERMKALVTTAVCTTRDERDGRPMSQALDTLKVESADTDPWLNEKLERLR